MALRRQVGADAIEIDTVAEFLRYAVDEPAEIDFLQIHEAVEGAGYTLRSVVLEVDGQVVSQSGRPVLRVATTGQILTLTGDPQPGQAGRVRAAVSGWAGPTPTLMVERWHEEGVQSGK